MQTIMKWGAMYGQLEDGEQISKESVQLGDILLHPGDQVSRIGKKKRSMFEMKDGYFLKYVGMVDRHLLFTSMPTGCDGDPWYYAFAYIDATTLLVGSHKGCCDIRVDDLQLSM